MWVIFICKEQGIWKLCENEWNISNNKNEINNIFVFKSLAWIIKKKIIKLVIIFKKAE